jgi:TP901 family phage tail tape measure protein
MPLEVPVKQIGLEASIDAAAKKAGRSLGVNLGKSAKSIDMLSQPLGRITGKADEFTKSMEAANARVLAFGASVGVLTTITKSFKDLVTTTIQVEKSMASINTILNANAKGLRQFQKEIFDVARNTEQSFDTVAEAALELSRQGLSAEEVLNRLNDSMVLSRLSGLGAAESVSGLTAAINSFKKSGLESSDILNKLSSAAAAAAVSERDLIEGIKRSASVANQAGVDFNELVGVITAVQQKTARGGAVIGNSFKTIFTRLQSFENLTTLQDLGVSVTDLTGKVLPATELIKNLSTVIAGMDEAAGQDLATSLVGRFQVSPFLAILDDYNSKTSVAIDITKVANNATTEAYERNEALNKTLSAAINETVVNLKELATTLGEIGVTDNLKTILGFFSNLVDGLQGLLDEETGSKFARNFVKGIANVISGPGLAIVAGIIGKLTLDLAKFGTGSLKTFFGLSRASKEIAATQGVIASTLLSNSDVQKQILRIENSTLSVEQKRVAQTKFFTTALNEQLAVMQRMQMIAGRVAPGVTAGTRVGGRRGRAGGYIPNFAGGFGAEMRDISAGVGGAPPTAKAVTIPNFNFGGGMMGPVVANDSEFIVPNFGGGGGSAIFNQDMIASMGLPAGARKINASSGIIGDMGSRRSGGKSIIRDKRFAMVVPQKIGVTTAIGKADNGQQYEFNVFGYDDGKLKGKTENQLVEDVKQFGIGLATQQATTLMGAKPTPAGISKLGNKGAVVGLAGAIFEAAIGAKTKKSPDMKDIGKQTQTFDYYAGEINGLRQYLFPSLPGSLFGVEAKINREPRQLNSMAGKMAKAGAGKATLSKKLKSEFMGSGAKGTGLLRDDRKAMDVLTKVTGQKFARGSRGYIPSLAGGFIPNFANGAGSKGFGINKAGRPYDIATGRILPTKEALALGRAMNEAAAASKNSAAADNREADASNKTSKTSEGLAGKLTGVLIASSFLTGAFADVDNALGRTAKSFGDSAMMFSSVALGADALGDIGKSGGLVNKVFKKIGLAGTIAAGVFGAFKVGKQIFMELNGEADAASHNTRLLADAADVAAVALNKLGEVDKEALRKTALEDVLGGRTAKNPQGQPLLEEAIMRALASGVKIGVTQDIIKDESPGGGAITGTQTTRIIDRLSREAEFTDERLQARIDQAFLKDPRLAKELLTPTVQNQIRFGGRAAGDPRLGEKFGQTSTGFGTILANPLSPLGELGEKLAREFNPVSIQNRFRERAKIEKAAARAAGEDALTDKQLLTARQVDSELMRGVFTLQRSQAGLGPGGQAMERSRAFGSLGQFDINEAKQTLNIEKARKDLLKEIGKELANINKIAKQPALDTGAAAKASARIAGLDFSQVNDLSSLRELVNEFSKDLFGEDQLESKFNEAQRNTLIEQLDLIRKRKTEEAEVLNILQQQTFEIETAGSVSEQVLAQRKTLEDKIISGELAFGAVRSASPFARARGKFQLNQSASMLAAFDKAADGDFTDLQALDLADQLNEKLISASENFATNIGDALVDAISKGQSLGDTLMSVAADFFNTMSKALMQNAIYGGLNKGSGIFGGLGNILGLNTGGRVTGGSGVRDDVPALLTGGEFVMNKKAVQNYGAGFMGALNSGAVPKYANGGLFTPGTYGQGSIKGSSNLLSFATQSYTGGLQDMFLSGSGLAGLSLEPQSGRLTMFGRKNSPAFQREQQSKRKAFDLFAQQYSKNQEMKQQKDAAGSNLLGSILGLGLSFGASSLFGSGLSGLFSKKATGGAVPYSAGIDSVPTMLSGGEFVMNAAATQRLGAGNLAALNAGAGSGGSSNQIVGKLDQLNETIASSNTEINITVNSDGTEATNSASAPEQQRSLAVKIKDVVRQVIEDEKRLGGSLRMA